MQHSHKKALLLYFLKPLPQLNHTLYETLQVKIDNLDTIHEQQAEIFPSIDDIRISDFMRHTRKTLGYYPGHLYIAHYNQLATINELHKVLSWIQAAPSKNGEKVCIHKSLPLQLTFLNAARE